MLYQFDESLLQYVEGICNNFTELENLSKSQSDLKDTISRLSIALDELILRFNERENILSSL